MRASSLSKTRHSGFLRHKEEQKQNIDLHWYQQYESISFQCWGQTPYMKANTYRVVHNFLVKTLKLTKWAPYQSLDMIGEKELSITAKRWCIFPESNICLFGMPKLHSLGDNKNGGGGIAPQQHRHGSPPQMPSFVLGERMNWRGSGRSEAGAPRRRKWLLKAKVFALFFPSRPPLLFRFPSLRGR